MRSKEDQVQFDLLKRVRHEYYNVFVTRYHSATEYKFVHSYRMVDGYMNIQTADKLFILPDMSKIKEIEIERTELEYSDDEIWESIKTGKPIRDLIGRRCNGRFA